MPFSWTAAVELVLDFALAFIFLQWVISFEDAEDRIDPLEQGQGEGGDGQVRQIRVMPRLARDGREEEQDQEPRLVLIEDYIFHGLHF